ncbi:NAC domain-containing protein 76-like [Syzygium oleosum]|uniref:NAC domain-containing protein 76-like n=1 Tax=Syzygium oleosum TaxID=219896 RepID=UPI0011D1A344|nr:NAC domain-containing protein 76-like [Syzygium oleosum]XP_030460519.1 NAC domain-containing protein 76-like [Syzygium oleosum]XP_056167738.1 NAC domain-containing protein 76-like [Syzygium oleosum]
MCPPAVEPLADIKYGCSDEVLFMLLELIIYGHSLPGNVITELNPYCYRPENLPDGMWYLTCSEDSKVTEHGIWKPKGDPLRVPLNSSISGWKTTLEFCELRASEFSKTDWIMQEYKITRNGSNCETRAKGANSLCKVFREHVYLVDQNAQTFDGSDISRRSNNLSTASLTITSRSNTEKGSTSNHQVVAADVPQNHPMEDLHANVDVVDDFLELRDLDIPQSPCSSSDNSSCMTMSSDACFDALALLQDIEAEQLQEAEQKDAHAKLSVSTVKPSNVVTHEVTSGSFTSHEREDIPKTGSSLLDTASAIRSKAVDGRNPKHVVGDGKSQSGCENVASRASTSENTSASERRRRKSQKKTKMLKKLCFIPFQFLC